MAAVVVGLVAAGRSEPAGRHPASGGEPGGAGSGTAVAVAAVSGAELVARLGCGGCHAGLPASQVAVRRLEAGQEGTGDALYASLVAGGGHVPDFRLAPAEAAALARHLGSGGGRGAGLRSHRAATAAEGARLFEALACGACHAGDGPRPPPAGPPLGNEALRTRGAWLAGFLRQPVPVRPFGFVPGSGARMPDFRLAAVEADSIAAFLLGSVRADAADPAPLHPSAARRVELLLTTRLSCLGCHALDGRGGRIGPDLSGVGARRTASHIRALLEDPARAAPGGAMPKQPLSGPLIEELTAYLVARTGVAPVRPAVDPGAGGGDLSLLDHAWLPASEADPYIRQCAACHGAGGRGDGFNARYLTVPPASHADAAAMAPRPDDTLYDGIHAGGLVLGRSPAMPPFGLALDDAAIRSLVERIRRLCACEGPAWSRRGGTP